MTQLTIHRDLFRYYLRPYLGWLEMKRMLTLLKKHAKNDNKLSESVGDFLEDVLAYILSLYFILLKF